ncbi:MAG TPA: thermonuclease family protein [Actinomycetes bacterium]|nr:thermonuclease family protein [Actinomycetes bacterium]
MSRLCCALVTAVLTVTLGGCAEQPQPAQQPAQQSRTTNLWRVVRVIDGDTIEVRRGNRFRTVRLIGIDTPETVHPNEGVECFGPEATRFTEEVLLGRRVTLEFDTSQGRRDLYGRTLAYVWIAAPHPRLFNLIAVRRGYALEYTFDRAYLHRDDFVEAASAAREARVGVWNCPTPGE